MEIILKYSNPYMTSLCAILECSLARDFHAVHDVKMIFEYSIQRVTVFKLLI